MTIKDCELELDENKYQSTSPDTLLFPCTAYLTDVKHQFSGELPWHWHEEIEMLIVKKGAIKISFSGKSIILDEGQGCFINSNTLHTAHTIMNRACILNSLLFLPSLISGSVESVFNQRYVKPLIDASHISCITFKAHIDWQRRVLETLNSAYDTYEASPKGFEWSIRESLSKIWYLIIENNSTLLEQPITKHDNTLNRVKTMLKFIHSNYPYPISLSEIATSANISDRECLRCFQENLDTSPMQYLIRYRINMASKHLLETDLAITMIAQEVGMKSSSYFSKKFKQWKGFTPSEYRKQKI